MSLIKSNSVLLAFDNSYLYDNEEFNFLPFIQSAKLSTKIQNLDKKFIGTQDELSHQFLPPEVSLDISYIQRDDFYNEKIFGFVVNDSESQPVSILSILSQNEFNNKNAFLLTTPELIDLITTVSESSFDTSMIAMSFGNLYLNSYSFAYSNGQLPVVSVGFLSNKLKVSNLTTSNSIYYMQNWDGQSIAIKKKKIDYLYSLSDQSVYNNIIYRMDYLSLESSLNNASIPLTSLNSFSNGVISSMSFSLNINRNNFYSFENSLSNQPIRKLSLPVIGSLTLTGLVDGFNNSNLDLLYNSLNLFSMSITIGNQNTELDANIHKLIFDNIRIDSFEYSTTINERIQYTMQCTFKVTENSGMKIAKIKSFDKIFFEVESSDHIGIRSSESTDLATIVDDMDDGY
jgi:hypothetical protein